MPGNRPRQFGWRPIEFTEYRSPDGKLFKFDELDRFLISEEGYGMPGVKYIDQTGPFQHGKTIYDYRLEPRVIQLAFRSNARGRNDYWLLRREIIDSLRPNRQRVWSFKLGTLRKTMPDATKFDIDCMIEQGPSFRGREVGSWDEWSVMETIRFICPDPTFYSPDAIDVTSTASGGAIPDTVITYTGTWMSFPKITLFGPLNDPVITNLETGEFLDMNGYNIASGDNVEFDLAFGRKTVISSADGNVIGMLSDDSALATFRIASDPEATSGVNTINVVGTNISNGTTKVNIKYMNRYIGI